MCYKMKKYLLAFYAVSLIHNVANASDDVQFNTDILDAQDKKNIDLSKFSKGGYIMPGEYTFKIKINQNEIEEQNIVFSVSKKDEKSTVPCFTPDIVAKFGFKKEYLDKLTSWNNGECIDITSLEGVSVSADLGSSVIAISIPQAYLEYVSENWVPSTMWDNGVPAAIFDYNFNSQMRDNRNSSDDQSLSGNGTMGANLGPWRARADWQMNYDDQSGSDSADTRDWSWSRFYLYRALPEMKAKLTLGEDYLNSDLFDSFRFTGASVISDDNMLPPNLRGYAPEVTGIAKTNAKVTISQQGRVIYETQVAAGPFNIQELSNAVSGTLDVRVQEQDGSVQTYKVSTANIPYLTRPGTVRYKVFAGRPTDYDHHADGDNFGSGEFSWGIDNGWSLYGGAVASSDYQSAAVGVGRDLLILGAIAFDITRSDATLYDEDRQGQSYRVSYSKRFDETNSQVTFAGYRFSEKDYMSFNDYLSYQDDHDDFMQGKEMYTLTFSQQFESLDVSAYLDYSHETYWNNPAEDRYSMSLSRYFDLGKFKNISASLTAYRNKFNGENDDGAYVSLSVPWGDNDYIKYDSSFTSESKTHRAGYYGHLNNGDSYQVAAGASDHDASMNGFYDHMGSAAELSANMDYENNQYTSVGMSLRGGATATTHGVALHRSGKIGGTRVMVDTEDASDVPVMGYGSAVKTNMFGKAVITDISDYSKNNLRIDLDNLPANADAASSVSQASLTEGAVGYRKFDVVSGLKKMSAIRLADGSFPPFGSVIKNKEGQDVGLVGDDGQVWLSGLKPGAELSAIWEGKEQCSLLLPESLDNLDKIETLLLLCKR